MIGDVHPNSGRYLGDLFVGADEEWGFEGNDRGLERAMDEVR